MAENNREPKKLTLCSRASDVLSRPDEFAKLVSKTGGVARKCENDDHYAIDERRQAIECLKKLVLLKPDGVPAGVARAAAELAYNVGALPKNVRGQFNLGAHDCTSTQIDPKFSALILGAIHQALPAVDGRAIRQERIVFGASIPT